MSYGELLGKLENCKKEVVEILSDFSGNLWGGWLIEGEMFEPLLLEVIEKWDSLINTEKRRNEIIDLLIFFGLRLDIGMKKRVLSLPK